MSTRSIIVALLLAGPAQAAPADIFILIDSSGSMSRPLGTGDARLVVAKQTARDVITAVKAQHRVGLARFAQLDRVLQGGEGKRPVLREDDQQCDHGSNLLAGLDLVGSDEALRWLDGVNELGNPEIVPLGDSPLVRGVEVAVEYIRNKRRADPMRHCVNAVLIVITDGVDTCVGGSEVRGTLADLAQKAAREDLRTLVLSFTPDAEAAQAIAKIGDPDGTPFSDPVKLLAAARVITGRLAPEACLASGVEPRKLGLPLPVEPDGGTACVPVPASGCGCDSSSAVPFIATLAVTAAFSTRRRRRVLVSSLVVMLFVGCVQTRPTCDLDTGTMPVSSLREPAQVRDDALSRLPVLLAGAEATRGDVLAPLLVSEQVFAKVSDADGCLTLARSIGFEPYLGVQRGVAGCLATRRCNSFDKALLLQACLRAKGASAELELCNETPMAMRQQLLAEAQKAVVMPDLSAAVAKEREVTLQVVGDAQRSAKLDTLTAERDVAVKQFFSGAIATDVSTLMPLAGLDAVATDTEATARAAAALVRYGFVRSGGRALDPTLAGSAIETGACADGPFVPSMEAVTIEAQVLLGYVGGSGAWSQPPIVAATMTVKPFEVFGEVLSMGVAEAGTQTLGAAVPAPSSTGCLRAFLEAGATRVRGQPFHIGPGDAVACPEPSLSVDETGKQLSRVTLRLTTMVAGRPTVVDRVLVDRYGFAASERAARASGPMYSDVTARRLLPMRADLRIVSGVLSPAALLDARLQDLALRRPELEAQISEVAGVPSATPPAGPPSTLPYAM
ncbi:MAG: hypothetical protein INH41_19735 [Myxococcaceae bacterium]|jgi:hypothetical protein|nr:hypothetical protein [Myxococcaceae bacterium]